MNVSLILRAWHEKLDSFSRENLRIEGSLHGVARSEQGEPFQLLRFDRRTCCFHDTDQRNRRLRRDLVEHNLGRVCRDEAKGCTSPRELADFLKQIISHARKVVCLHEIQSLFQTNTVDYELRITPIASALPIKRNDSPVIIDRTFRAEPANDSKSLHLLTTNPPSLKLRPDMWTRTVKCRSTNVECRINDEARMIN